MKQLGWFLLGILLVGTGCKNQNKLVVYTDPWAGDFVTAAVEEFNGEEKWDINLRILSTETILQHLHFGQPIDAVVLLDTGLIHVQGMVDDLEGIQTLAPARVVRARRLGPLNPNIPGAGGTVLEASHRPTRRWTERWLGTTTFPDSVRYANFYKQCRDYLLRGWVRDGFVLESLAKTYPDRLEVMERGPEIRGGFVTARPKTGRNPLGGQKFSDFLQSEKTQNLLAAYHLIP